MPAELPLQVVPAGQVHVELVWSTPGDPDPADAGPDAGADVDLHFAHPLAVGEDIDGDGAPDGWFDVPFDAHFCNPKPNWGSLDPKAGDDPGLDRDDQDGAGPENVVADALEGGRRYRVAAHYWNAHGYGPSSLTLRIYLGGALAWTSPTVELIEDDLWEIAELLWPPPADGSPAVEPIGAAPGVLRIVPFPRGQTAACSPKAP